MYFLFLSALYLIGFVVQSSRDFFSNEYDHDVDQFMYFGSRLLNGELIWTEEFDDKSPVVQFLFAVPAYFKSTGLWVLISIFVAILASSLLYLMIVDSFSKIEIKYNISRINRINRINRIAIFSAILYLTLQAYIFGSLIHINSFCSSLNLIIICFLYFAYNKKIRPRIKNSFIIFASLLAAISISVRPYLTLPIIFTGLWVIVRSGFESAYKEKSNGLVNIRFNYGFFIKWIFLVFSFGIIINLTPYIITNNTEAILAGLRINSFELVKHNIFLRQYINLGRNPILYPVLLSFILLPYIWFISCRRRLNSFSIQKKSYSNMNIDILFFTLICPLLLEISFISRHFWGHYFNFFTPYASITFAYLIFITMHIDDYHTAGLVTSIRNIFLVIIMTVCLLTDRGIINSLDDIFLGNGEAKINELEFVRSISDGNSDFKSIEFLFPENNYVHWKLSQSRHGFPQKIVYRNIKDGKMDEVINTYKGKEFNFLLPVKENLCQTLIDYAPTLIITKDQFTYKCLQSNNNHFENLNFEDPKATGLHVFKRIEQQIN